MIEIIKLICIQCPIGCNLLVALEQGTVTHVTGNSCPRGAEYATQEITAPKRTFTATVRITNGLVKLLPVVSEKPLPKNKLFDCMKNLQNVSAKAPIKMGEVVVHNIDGLGINILASRDVDTL